MFLGDMILYYDPNDYDGRDTINSIIGIMKNVSTKRLYLGGLLGPISAFIYCIGFYHIVLSCQENYLSLACFVFLINIFGMSTRRRLSYSMCLLRPFIKIRKQGSL